MQTTQQHLSISDIKDDLVILKDGGGAIILQTNAVNFGLLSQREQVAIISSFAQMLNSLSFSIQIVIISERLNISSYINLLDKAQKAQNNSLLSNMMASYRQFIQTTVKENEVLDKKFYIVIPLFKLELGITPTPELLQQKIKTVLFPRRDQIIRQLGRIGLKATQLSTEKLIELFFNIYNGSQQDNANIEPVRLRAPQSTSPQRPSMPSMSSFPSPSQMQPLTPSTQPGPARNHPFVVEELDERV